MRTAASGRKRALVWGAGLAAILVIGAGGLLAWNHRLELFVIPGILREALRLSALVEQEDSTGPGGLSSLQEELDGLLGRLVGLREPGFKRGSRFRLERLRSREQGLVYFVWYRGALGGCCHLLLDLRGRRLPNDFQVFERHTDRLRHHIVRESSSSFDVVRVVEPPDPRFDADDQGDFSVDARGWVPHGRVGGDELHAPVAWGSIVVEHSPDLAPYLLPLLSSPREGDIFRALYLIEHRSAGSLDLALPLLEHPSAEVRARAVAVVGSDPLPMAYLAPRLKDPDPRVRLAAAYALQDTEEGSRAIEPLASDHHPAVAKAVRLMLAR